MIITKMIDQDDIEIKFHQLNDEMSDHKNIEVKILNEDLIIEKNYQKLTLVN